METKFDALAAGWEGNPVHLERTRAIAAALRRRVPLSRTWTAIEFGAGTGLLSFALCGELASVAAIDSSRGMVDVLADKVASLGGANVHPVCLDLSREPFSGGNCDLVFSQMALHHVPDTAGMLGRLHSLLVPGGWLALADLDLEDGSFHGPGEDVHPGFERTALLELCRAAGFGELAIETVFVLSKAGRSYPVFLLVGRAA